MSRRKVTKKNYSRKHRTEYHESVRKSAFPLSSRVERSGIPGIGDPLSSDDNEGPPKFIKSYIKPNKNCYSFTGKFKEYYHGSSATKRLLPVLSRIQSPPSCIAKRARLSDSIGEGEIDKNLACSFVKPSEQVAVTKVDYMLSSNSYKRSHISQKESLPEIHSNSSLATYQGQFSNTATFMGPLKKDAYRSKMEEQIIPVTVPDRFCHLAVFDTFPVEDILRELNKRGYAIVSSELDLDQEEQQYFVHLSGVDENSQTVKVRDNITATTEHTNKQTKRSTNLITPQLVGVNSVKSGKFQENTCRESGSTLSTVFVDTLAKVANANVEARKRRSEKRVDRKKLKAHSMERERSPMSRILGSIGKDISSDNVSPTTKIESDPALPIHNTDSQAQKFQSSRKVEPTNPRSVLKKTICLSNYAGSEGILTRNNRVRFSNPLVHIREFEIDNWDYNIQRSSSKSPCSTDQDCAIGLSAQCSSTRLDQFSDGKVLFKPSKSGTTRNYQSMEHYSCVNSYTTPLSSAVETHSCTPKKAELEEGCSQSNPLSHKLSSITESNKRQVTQQQQDQLHTTNSILFSNEEASTGPVDRNSEVPVHLPKNQVRSTDNDGDDDTDTGRLFIVDENVEDPTAVTHHSVRNDNTNVSEQCPKKGIVLSGQVDNMEGFVNQMNNMCRETAGKNHGPGSQEILSCINCMTHGEKNLANRSHTWPLITCTCQFCFNNNDRLEELKKNFEQGDLSGPLSSSVNKRSENGKLEDEIEMRSVMDSTLKKVHIIVEPAELHEIVHEANKTKINSTNIPETNQQLEVTNELTSSNVNIPKVVNEYQLKNVKQEPKDEDDVQLLFMGQSKYLDQLYASISSRPVDSKFRNNEQRAHVFSTANGEKQPTLDSSCLYPKKNI